VGQGDCRSLEAHLRIAAQADKALRVLGYRVGRQQARSLMREAGVWVRYRRRFRVTTTNSNHRQAVFENRVERNFEVEAPDHVDAGDITCPCGRSKDGCTLPWSLTCTRARSWVGRWDGA